jgi:hypothetical protein
MMNYSLFIKMGVLGVVFGGVCAAAKSGPMVKKDISLSAEVEKYVLNYFESQPEFSSAYLITREQTQPLLEAFRHRGWDSKMLDSLASRLVSKEEFLARELDSKTGRKFMTQIAKYPQAYDYLDRLSRLPVGQQTVHNLVYNLGGEQMIEFLTTRATGKEFVKLFSQTPSRANFGKPTGRIYTAPMLVDAFRKEITGKQKISEK